MRGLCVVCWLCSEDLMGLFCELGERGTTMEETRKRTGAYYYYVVTEILYWVLIMIMLN